MLAGETLTEFPMTTPIPEIDSVVAPLTDQESVEDPPEEIEEGLAENEAMTGTVSTAQDANLGEVMTGENNPVLAEQDETTLAALH